MTKFEQIGSQLQMDCVTSFQATQKFRYSCKVCCERGIRVQCDTCAIRATHEQVMEAIEQIALDNAEKLKKGEVCDKCKKDCV